MQIVLHVKNPNAHKVFAQGAYTIYWYSVYINLHNGRKNYGN